MRAIWLTHPDQVIFILVSRHHLEFRQIDDLSIREEIVQVLENAHACAGIGGNRRVELGIVNTKIMYARPGVTSGETRLTP